MATLIVGLVGTIGSGKTTLAKELQKNGFSSLRFSVPLEKEIEKRGLNFERINYQTIADEFRKKNGPGYLSSLLIEEMEKDSLHQLFIIDGFRNPGEIAPFRKFKEFVLIALDAPKEIRYQRLVSKNDERSPKSLTEFTVQENRDNGLGEPEWGQNISGCLKLADYTFDTNKTLDLVYNEALELIQKLRSK